MNWRSAPAKGGGPSREGLEAAPNKSHLFIRLCLYDSQKQGKCEFADDDDEGKRA